MRLTCADNRCSMGEVRGIEWFARAVPTRVHGSTVRRIGHVEDHETMAIGLATVLAADDSLELVAVADTVAGLLARTTDLDLAILDLRLGDGSTPRSNVDALAEHGIDTLVYTCGEDPYLMRAAAKAGVLGILLKSTSATDTLDAIRLAAHGTPVPTQDWAAAIDGDPALREVGLTPRQLDVLALYANGEKAATVARMTGLAEQTVVDYLGRIRKRYAEAGRPAPTKTDLYKRALEDGWLPRPERPSH